MSLGLLDTYENKVIGFEKKTILSLVTNSAYVKTGARFWFIGVRAWYI